jgi:hypothetical protein
MQELKGSFNWRDEQVSPSARHLLANALKGMTRSKLILDCDDGTSRDRLIAIALKRVRRGLLTYTTFLPPKCEAIWLLYYLAHEDEDVQELLNSGLVETMKDLVLVRYGGGYGA